MKNLRAPDSLLESSDATSAIRVFSSFRRRRSLVGVFHRRTALDIATANFAFGRRSLANANFRERVLRCVYERRNDEALGGEGASTSRIVHRSLGRGRYVGFVRTCVFFRRSLWSTRRTRANLRMLALGMATFDLHTLRIGDCRNNR